MKHYARLLLVLTGLIGLAAQAQTQREAIVTVPFEFVANGTTLPAGTYTVSRDLNNPVTTLVLSSYTNRVGILVLPVESVLSSSEEVKLRFEQVGNMRFLSRIETLGRVYNVRIPQSVTAVADVRSHGAGASGAK